MTQVEVCRDPEGLLCGFLAQGHAGARKSRGYDLVCAGISALTQAGVNALETVVGITPLATVQDGFLSCQLPSGLTQDERVRADIVLRTITQGLLDIQTAYPAHIRVAYKEWR
jgi:uncharacterized protein YsxB (DUF464 family)